MTDFLIWVLLYLLPLLLLAAGGWAGVSHQSGGQIARRAVVLSQFVLGLYGLLLLLCGWSGLPTGAGHWLSVRPVSLLLLGLVLFIGWVVLRFSRHYMAGEPRQGFFYRWLLLTLAAVCVTVSANHLLVLLAGWLAISLALHRLLLFYPNRPRTVLAAHKKFIIARGSELCLALAFFLLFDHFGTADIDQILTALPTTVWTPWLTLAACGLVLTALLKCAQLPVHGWLIQVVDAPTPVSALLHAGVINLGGYLLILFAPLLIQSPLANGLLLLLAGSSLVLAALIMQTRVSVKVRLAWSTSAQMGFMLLECALGLYELAFLHLVAHSLYKAHAFLTAGQAVSTQQYQQLCQQQPAISRRCYLLHWLLLSAAAGLIYLQFGGALVLWLLLALAAGSFLSEHSRYWPLYGRALIAVGLIGGCLLLWKQYAAQYLALPTGTVSLGSELWLALLLGVLAGASVLLRQNQPSARWQRQALRFQQRLFAGLYLDEWLTRLTQRVWPVALHQPTDHV